MKATRTFTDNQGVTRKNGEEWLIKMEDTEAHIPDVYEEVSSFSHTPPPPPSPPVPSFIMFYLASGCRDSQDHNSQ